MPGLFANESRFYLECAQLDKDTFQVVSFEGTEELSRLFRFELELISEDPEIDFAKVINQPAGFGISREIGWEPVNGMITQFEQANRRVLADERKTPVVVYRAVLEPRMARLKYNFGSRIFQEMSVPEIIQAVVHEAGFSTSDLELNLQGSYPTREYCVQYQETDLNFISRLMEHEGICYFFKHAEDESETMILVDAKENHDYVEEPKLSYDEAAGMLRGRENQSQEAIQQFNCKEQIVTGKVVLHDYNYETPDINLQVESQINPDMPGIRYDYGPHYKDVDQGQHLATLRNEQIECRRRIVDGRSTSPGLRAGFLFTLIDHYRFDLNEDYLAVKVEHKGSQEAALFGGVEGRQTTDEYSNHFICQPAKVQYRPPARARIPRLDGVVNALIENKQGPYAQIDEQGRYRTSFMFDLDHPSSDGSLPIRMIQPNAGSQYGQHFPLHEKVEVLLACINGDPDRPVVVGAVPNPNNASPATNSNRWQNVIRTWGQNELTFDDKQGEENIYMKATKDNTRQVTNNESISVGNDRTKSVGHDETTSIGNDRTETVDANENITIGQNRTESVGADETITIGGSRQTTIGVNDTQNVTENRVVNIGSSLVESVGVNLAETVGGEVVITVGKDQTVNIGKGQTVTVANDQNISVGGKKSETVSSDIQVSSGGKLSISAATEIVLSVGSSSINIKASGITISGPKISSTAMGIHEISGALVKIN